MKIYTYDGDMSYLDIYIVIADNEQEAWDILRMSINHNENDFETSFEYLRAHGCMQEQELTKGVVFYKQGEM